LMLTRNVVLLKLLLFHVFSALTLLVGRQDL